MYAAMLLQSRLTLKSTYHDWQIGYTISNNSQSNGLPCYYYWDKISITNEVVVAQEYRV